MPKRYKQYKFYKYREDQNHIFFARLDVPNNVERVAVGVVSGGGTTVSGLTFQTSTGHTIQFQLNYSAASEAVYNICELVYRTSLQEDIVLGRENENGQIIFYRVTPSRPAYQPGPHTYTAEDENIDNETRVRLSVQITFDAEDPEYE